MLLDNSELNPQDIIKEQGTNTPIAEATLTPLISEFLPADSEQYQWLDSVLQKDQMDALLKQPGANLEMFTYGLCEAYRSIQVKGANTQVRDRRVNFINDFLQGLSPEDTAEKHDVRTSTVVNGLKNVAELVVKELPASELHELSHSPILYAQKQQAIAEFKAKKLSYYTVALLAELELKPVDISNEHKKYAIRSELGIEKDRILNTSIKSLTENGYAKIDETEEVKTIDLTPAGLRFVDFVKDNFDALNIHAPAEKKVKGSTFHFLDMLNDLTGGDPEMILTLGKDSNIYPYLSQIMGMSEDALSRNIRRLVNKEYVKLYKRTAESSEAGEAEIDNTYEVEASKGPTDAEGGRGSTDPSTVYGISITKDGIEYMQRIIDHFADKDLRDEKKVEEIDELITTCLELNIVVKDAEIEDRLQELRNGKHMFEMSELELRRFENEILDHFKKLKQEYLDFYATAA